MVAAIEAGADPDRVAALWASVFVTTQKRGQTSKPSQAQRRRHQGLPAELRSYVEKGLWEMGQSRSWRHYQQGAGYQVQDRTRILHRGRNRSLGIEHIDQARFGRRDNALALDASRVLKAGTSTQLRVQVTPKAELLPKLDISGRIRQDLGGGWTGEVGGHLAQVPGSDLREMHLEFGKVQREWYAGYRGTLVRYLGASSGVHRLFARRYLRESVDNFLELGVASGRAVSVASAGPTLQRGEIKLVELRYQRYLNSRFGLFVLASMGDYERLPDFQGVLLGLLVRWS
jgi:YaiO family outer membrane protein